MDYELRLRMCWLKFIASLAVALLLVIAFRALAFTIYTIPAADRTCGVAGGDRVVVSRWSYGLRTGDDRLFPYARLFKSEVVRGDVVAFNPPIDSVRHGIVRPVLLGRIKAVPGDTVSIEHTSYSLPHNPCPSPCLGAEYYLVYSDNGIGKWLVQDKDIIGKVLFVLYNVEYNGGLVPVIRKDRTFMYVR